MQRPGCGLSKGLSLTEPWWEPEEGAGGLLTEEQSMHRPGVKSGHGRGVSLNFPLWNSNGDTMERMPGEAGGKS